MDCCLEMMFIYVFNDLILRFSYLEILGISREAGFCFIFNTKFLVLSILDFLSLFL